jgi:hypothetical protein
LVGAARRSLEQEVGDKLAALQKRADEAEAAKLELAKQARGVAWSWMFRTPAVLGVGLVVAAGLF